MTPHKTEPNGFTLIELLVVLAIMAITLMVAIPSIRTTLINSRLTASANDMIVALQIARSESIKRMTSAGVSGTSSTGATTNINQWVAFYNPGTTLIQSYTAARGITVTSNDYAPTYRPDGRLSSLSNITMTFAAAGVTETRILKIQSSGRVCVYDPDELPLSASASACAAI
jgi:type IV fimbrial biogenesis protein FimT